jgi:hypothetical protein
VLEAQVPQTKALLEKCDLSFRFPPGWGSTGHSKAFGRNHQLCC